MSTKRANRKFCGRCRAGLAGKAKAYGWFSWCPFFGSFFWAHKETNENSDKIDNASINGAANMQYKYANELMCQYANERC